MDRTRVLRLLTLTALTVFAVVLATGITWAQTPPPADTFKVNYFSNAHTAGAPDGTVYLSNPGTSGGTICAMVYVINPSQELLECCGCAITPDGLRTLSINNNLTSNPLTPETLTSGTIKVISSAGAPTCNPGKPVPTPAIRAWATHIQPPTGFGPFVTETEFLDATLSSYEITHVSNLCKSIQANGSGYGVCSCGVGD